jgi:hypothetical protein
VLGAGHLFVAALFAVYMARGSHDAQWQLGWLPLIIADLPISIVLYPIAFQLVGPHLSAASAWSDPDVILPTLIHCAFGSLLYLLVPPFISAFVRPSESQGG